MINLINITTEFVDSCEAKLIINTEMYVSINDTETIKNLINEFFIGLDYKYYI